jgi:hypothetical protein
MTEVSGSAEELLGARGTDRTSGPEVDHDRLLVGDRPTCTA